MENNYKIDPLTGEQFIPSKSTQRFARPENRIKFNNRKAALLNLQRAFFDKPCKKSQTILISLYNPDSDNIFHRKFLEGMGFGFDAYNRAIETKYGKLPAYYDYAVRRITNTDNIQIIKL
jgi:hypothetical protein